MPDPDVRRLELALFEADSGWIGHRRIAVDVEYDGTIPVSALALHLARALSEELSR